MADTTLLIRRSEAVSIPGALANGELAWSGNGGILYIGANGAIVPVGGTRTPGVWTANQDLTVNSTGMVDVLRVGNSTVNAVINSLAFTIANSTATFSLIKPTAAQIADGGYYPAADGVWKLVSSSSPGGLDTHVQFNDGGSTLLGEAGFTYNKTTDVATLAGGLLVGANISLDTVRLSAGNTTANLIANSILVKVENATASANLGPGLLVVGTQSVNTTALVAGANVFLSTVHLKMGNSTVNSTSNSEQLTLFTAAHGATMNSSSFAAGSGAVLSAGPFLLLGNTTVNSVANSIAHVSQNSTVSSTFAIGGVTVGANVILDTINLSMGNTTANLIANSILVKVHNATASANLGPGLLVVGTSSVNTTAHVAGANVFLDTVTLSMGNTTANLVANSILVKVHNATASANIGPGLVVVGTQSVNTTAFVAGANVFLNTVTLSMGNTVANLIANSILVKVHNATASANLGPGLLTIGTSVVNTTTLAAGANVIVGTVNITIGNSTVNSVSNSLVTVLSNSSMTSSFGIGGANAGANVQLTVTGYNIGNSTINVASNNTMLTLKTASATANLTASGLVVGSSTLDATSLSVQDAVISGNLTINGTLTNIDSTNLVVEDPMIKLAKNNDAGDTLDIGFYGLCDPTAAQDTYTGFFRDATDDKYKLYHLLQTEPTTTVDTAGTGYAQATLVCALESNNVNITGGTIDCGTF